MPDKIMRTYAGEKSLKITGRTPPASLASPSLPKILKEWNSLK